MSDARSTSRAQRAYYLFIGTHSLLIGLLPFYLPALSWQRWPGVSPLAWLIAATGCGFLLALPFWRHIATHQSLRVLMVASLPLELLLVCSLALPANGGGLWQLVLIGFCSGAYNGFFWTTQRIAFVALLNTRHATGHAQKHELNSADQLGSGRLFGNVQIVVALGLKSGVLLGGVLLADGALAPALLVSAAFGVLGSALVWQSGERTPCLSVHEPITIWQSPWRLVGITAPLAEKTSRRIFLLDGPFLFLESHVWLLAMYLVLDENLLTLGLAVIALGIAFMVLFMIVKNRIDQWPAEQWYRRALAGYILSWLGRAAVVLAAVHQPTGIVNAWWLAPMLLSVTFLTSFFRLAFNKRFFDHAQGLQQINAHAASAYLLWKSALSQSMLLGFAPLALLIAALHDAPENAPYWLSLLFVLAAISALGFLHWPAANGSILSTKNQNKMSLRNE